MSSCRGEIDRGTRPKAAFRGSCFPEPEEVMWHGVKQRYIGVSIKDFN
jgi:hypothetical protein